MYGKFVRSSTHVNVAYTYMDIDRREESQNIFL